MESEPQVKRIIICGVCSEFKAKHNCQRCDKPICLSCKKYYYVGYDKYHSICESCKNVRRAYYARPFYEKACSIL